MPIEFVVWLKTQIHRARVDFVFTVGLLYESGVAGGSNRRTADERGLETCCIESMTALIHYLRYKTVLSLVVDRFAVGLLPS